MPSRIQHFISALDNPSLLHNPEQAVEGLLRDMLNVIGKKMIVGGYGLHPGNKSDNIPFHEIMRIRPNQDITQIFLTRSSLSFKPQEFNTTYQRASTPEQTMFYGSLSDKRNIDLPNRMTSTLEGIPWLRDPTTQGMQKVTFSKWLVRQSLMLTPVLFNPEFIDNQHVTENLERTRNSIYELNPEFADDILQFYSFIATKFGNTQIEDNYLNYLVTSIFTKIFLEQGAGKIDGVLYPSCRVYGKGTNVAILPAATEKLDLVVAGECMIYKNGEKVIIDNITVSDSDGETPLTNFTYVPVDESEIRGQKQIFEELGVNHLEYRN